MDDYFSVLGLPRRLEQDGEDLQRRFYALSRRHHPDFHQTADAGAQARALEQSALVNRAYRALREPLTRLEHAMGLEEGRDATTVPAAKPRAPRALLLEMLEVQEALEEARDGGMDEDARRRLGEERERLGRRRADEEAAILERFAEWDCAGEGGRGALLEWFGQALAARAYLRTVIDDLDQALRGDQAAHAARRGN